MNDNRTVKRTKSSRTKELEENDDDEDDSERRKATDTWPEVNGNIVHDTYQTKNKHYPEMNSTSRIDNFKYGSRSEGHSPYETARTSTNAQYEMSLLNGKLSMNSGKRHGRKNKEEHCNTDDNSSCCGERIQNENACPSECEYCTNSIANNVKNSYWHCLEVEQYSNKHNTWSPCNSGSNNVNRMQVVDDSVLCEKSDCIYLPFENVTKEKSCFRKNCSCNQKYLIKNLKSKEKMTKKNEILLSPSGLSNEDYSACNCNVPNCCENNAKQSDIYFRTQSHQSSYQLNDDGACGSKEKRKSNHFKEKVNQVLPNLMASVVHNQNQIENQNEEISRGNSSYQLCSENIVHGNSCENCSECNNSTCSPNSNVNKNHGVTNSLIPIDSLVPNNNVPLQNRNHDLCPDPNIFPTHSGYAEKSEGSQNDVKCTEEQFLNIKIKLSSDNNQKQEGSSCTSTYITESASDECSNKSATIESNLERESPKDVENAPENDEKRPQTNSEILEVNKLLVENMPTSSKYLTSPLRNPRKKTNREQRPKSIPERKAKRQFYTPYEEALSSLLWQPYDCRNSGLATMEVSDMSDSDDQTRRNVHRSRRKSGPRVSKHDRADHRPAETNNLASYVFDIPPEYALMEGFQSFDYSQFISECDSSLLCRNCKINLFVEDNDEFRGKYFCFNCKELKRFLNENNTMTDSELMTQFKNEKLRASLDGACGLSHYPISVPSASSSILPNPLVPNFYLKGQVRTKHHSKCKSNSNELGKRPKQNQDNDTCSSTLSSSYSSSSSLSSLELAPLGAPPSTELELESGGSGTALAQSSAVPCRVNVCQVESRELHSDTSVSTQNKKLKSPRSNNNVDSKMLVNISNSNHNLSLSQSNLLSSSSNNLTSNPCDNSSENLVNIVSCYRAVPVTTSSGGEPNQNTHHVPTSDNQTPNPTYTNTSSNLIQSNGVGSGSSHLKNVNRCVSSVSVSANVNGLPPPPQGVGVAKPLPTTSRTFISTEAQTDEIILNRDQRRRERRERRQQRRLAQQLQQWPSVPPQDRIPDILHSHVPPPYSTLPLGVLPCSTSLPPSLSSPPSLIHPSLPNLPPSSHCGSPLHNPPSHTSGVTSFAGIRFPFTIVPSGRRRSRLSRRGSGYTPEEEPKTCCGVSMTIRWFICIILVIGFLCVVIGCVLGTMNTGYRQHVSVSLLMIGVGIILVTVSGLAWRLSVYRDESTPTWRMLLGLSGNHSNTGEEGSGEPNRRFVPRLPPSYGRPHHPYAAMMYPEFQFRPPPPSYQASMQEYRLRLLLLDRQTTPPTTVSPPPTYRSHSGSLLRAPLSGCQTLPRPPYLPPTPSPSLAASYTSRPPSYRSRPPSLHPGGAPSVCHSRDSSDLSERGNVISVVNTELMKMMNGADNTETDAILKMIDTESTESTETILREEKQDLVTVVTSLSTQVIVEQVPPGEHQPSQSTAHAQQQQSEMHILAHL